MLGILTKYLKQPEYLDFPEVQVEEDELPAHLIPNEQMRQNFINNCKDMGVWE